MESNEQTEPTCKIVTGSFIESRTTAMGDEGLGGGGIEPKRKRTHGHEQQCGDCGEARYIRGINGNGKI